MKPPKGWKLFCENYTVNNAYWYIPKGQAIKEDNFDLIKSKLKILKKYESKNWSECQLQFVKELAGEKLFQKRAGQQSKRDKGAIGRVFKVICATLGFAWVNENEKIVFTQIGNLAIKSKNFSIFQKQVNRFQFYNPSCNTKEHKIIRVNPIYFLNSILLNLESPVLTKEEYTLFVAKQQGNSDIEKSIELIEKYRKLPIERQQQLTKYLRKVRIDSIKQNRSSIFNTIELESSYALQFFGCSSYLLYDGALKLKNKKKAKQYVKDFEKNEVWIDFKGQKDWILYYGQALEITSSEYARDYYVDISDVEAGLSFLSEKKRRGLKVVIDEEKYKDILIDEKLLEDFLENHLHELEPGLKLIKRQKVTLVGRIDLFATDKNGYCVIIELKKGRTADKVLGQTLRYVGFIKENEANCRKVRAIIVGKSIDEKLKYAVKAARISCNLYEFDFGVRFKNIAVK